eukprot:3936907-Rhodomonas_salina.2
MMQTRTRMCRALTSKENPGKSSMSRMMRARRTVIVTGNGKAGQLDGWIELRVRQEDCQTMLDVHYHPNPRSNEPRYHDATLPTRSWHDARLA